ncbi:preprotein translocase subunit SecA [candidate division WWE3 bacterium]|jgi:preprotein translocase subunit SecA|uniref:Protein translocase subunit SecA n=1 Tax=candidate division WWE3 bacterium TaxID=2053526 RepID=A0A3A4ZE28_UNCKA|nr:MAG: preprotein translocase subunit SecA [candidate division WWE3 bacterium]
MLNFLFDSNEKQIRVLKPVVDQINKLETEVQGLSREELVAKTNSWQNELKGMSLDTQKKYLDEILPEAFSVVREAGKRVLNMRHFDVQLMAGMALHQGKISEQKTGEGKTLTATLPLYLNSLTGRGVHLVTPNDYLSRHGAGWMGPLYDYLGIKVGVIMEEKGFVYDSEYVSAEFEDSYATHLKAVPKQEAYKADIVYGTNHQFGFDYLRDNMVASLDQMVQTNPNGSWGEHYFAIVDEVDSILIDMARTPLIISTSDERSSERYAEADRIVKSLSKDTDYEVEEKFRNATLTDFGIRRVERLLGAKNLYEEDFEMVHLIEQALTAHALFEKDKDYVVKNGKVMIVDQFTGRILENNRFSHGLHQAIEAKEGVEIQKESKTLGEISYQNYFRMYTKLAGMTGTAVTEAEEFYKIYKLDVVSIPTNKPNIRIDNNDMVYKSEAGKFRAVADEIVERNKLGQPVLVGTTSVEKSELLHELLKRRGVPHEILNAKNHEREALIIAQAGKKGSVTISTNMAGRGVDIILGGDPPEVNEHEEVKKIGGLHVIGTERHESRRIDNQLRGRAGRQGDPGSSRFYVSLQDDLMRIFGGESIQRIMDKFGLDDTVPMEAGLVTKSIENAQKKVEGFNFDRRKHVVEMDDVMNVHRDVVYKLRRRILEIANGNDENEDWFIQKLQENSGFDPSIWQAKKKEFGKKLWGAIVSEASRPVVDILWMEHLVDMDQIREGIGLRGYAQRDPMVEYKKEGHERFSILVSRIYSTIGQRLISFDKENVSVKPQRESLFRNLQYQHSELESGVSEEYAAGAAGEGSDNPRYVDESGRELKVEKVVSGKEKVGRNDPCPCGSGKKYKHCHGK